MKKEMPCFQQIITSGNWIVEGSPRKSLRESFECCEYIIVLDERTIIRLARVFKKKTLWRTILTKVNLTKHL